MDSPIPSPTEEAVLEEILGKIEPKLKRILSRHRIPPQDADDLVQETLLIMVSKAGSIHHPEAWLQATLANRCIIYWRRRRNHVWEQVDTAILELLADPEAPVQEREELRYDLEALLTELPERCRSLLRLRYCLGCSASETAESLGYQRSSIRKLTQRCLATLTARLLGSGSAFDI
jgi:RNA polymerase sigma-70 factor, ECF subfamily